MSVIVSQFRKGSAVEFGISFLFGRRSRNNFNAIFKIYGFAPPGKPLDCSDFTISPKEHLQILKQLSGVARNL